MKSLKGKFLFPVLFFPHFFLFQIFCSRWPETQKKKGGEVGSVMTGRHEVGEKREGKRKVEAGIQQREKKKFGKRTLRGSRAGWRKKMERLMSQTKGEETK